MCLNMMLFILVAIQYSFNGFECGFDGAEHGQSEKFEIFGFYRKFKYFAAVKIFINFALGRSPAYDELT